MGVLIVTRDRMFVDSFNVAGEPLLIGGDSRCQVRVDGANGSDRLAAIVEKNGTAALKLLAPGVHVLLNDKTVGGTSLLHDGDCLKIGDALIHYRSGRPTNTQRIPCSDVLPVDGPANGAAVAAGEAEAARASVAAAGTSPVTISKSALSGEEKQPASARPVPPAASAAAPVEQEVAAAVAQAAGARAAPLASPASVGSHQWEDEPQDTDGDDDEIPVETGDGGDSLAIGEFEADPAEDVEIPKGNPDVERLPVPEALQNFVRERLAVHAELDRMEKRRTAMLQQEGLSEAVQSELRRQSREVTGNVLPGAEAARGHIERTQKKVEAAAPKEDGAEAPALDDAMRAALGMAVHQWELFIRLEQTLAGLVPASLPLMRKEPLFWVLQEAGVEAETLFGWAFYALALEAVQAQQNDRRRGLRGQRTEMTPEKKGLLRVFGGGPSSSQVARLEELTRAEEESANIVTWATRELALAERPLVDRFWKVYEEAACLLVRGGLGRQEEIQLRAFVRWGLLGCHPYFLPTSLARWVLTDASSWRSEWDDSMEATHVIYADEYLCFVGLGAISPSLDEDLELNQRNSPAWKADKAWRRLIYIRVRERALAQTRATLDERITRLRSKQAASEAERDHLSRGSIDYKKRYRELGQAIQHSRVEAARFERAVDRIDNVLLPNLALQRQEANDRLAESGIDITPEQLVRREVTAMRRVARLTANLKEPFLPLVLRDSLRPDSDAVSDRASMLAELAQVEKSDPSIFVEPLLQAKKKSHRIEMRFCPVFLLTPACGFLGYAWNPRSGPEFGRLAFPAYTPRPRMRERMLHNVFSDFRWDTSKASAGVDLLTSDTLVAAYATVRWEYRKRSKEAREKAAIFNEDNDRKNWRRHYGLYLSSAQDGGKKLFHKNPECYEQVVLRYIDLPEGVERLRR